VSQRADAGVRSLASRSFSWNGSFSISIRLTGDLYDRR
jgi:hypothetical protein